MPYLAGHAVDSKTWITPETTGAAVFSLFNRFPELAAVAVIGARQASLLNRTRFLLHFGNHLHQAVYERRSIVALANTAPLIVDARLPFSQLIQHVQEHPSATQEGYIVIHKGRFFGVGGAAALNRVAAASAREQARQLQQTTEALKRSEQEAQAANEAKSRFLSNMTHELRTPLNAIIGYAEMIEEDLGDEHDQLRADIGRIEAAGRHLLALVGEVLDLSKIEAGRTELQDQRFDADVWLREALDMIALLAERNGNRLDIDAAANLGPARGDPVRLRQCLLNLASNACKFTERGVITVSAHAEGERLHLSVADTGIGMNDEQRARLFAPFTQADSTISARFGGTGLGLAITKGLIEAMGGELAVASAPGRGSRFSFWTPCLVTASNGAAAA